MTEVPSRPAGIRKVQLAALRRLIAKVAVDNRFYGPRLRHAGIDPDIDDLEQFTSKLGFTTKQQIIEDQLANPPYGTNLTYPLDRYTRMHQTSATTGAPLRWLDTPESWQSILDDWKRVFGAAGVGGGDRILFAFSFGPFLGFWSAFESALQMGSMVIPAGGMTSGARLRMMLENQVTVLCCTPTYAIRLVRVAAEEGIDLSNSKIRRIVVAGEPGGSVPATRRWVESRWPGASLFDHHGMTEVGPVSYQNPNHPGTLHVMEESFIAEVIDPQTNRAPGPGQVGELVLSTLNRTGTPLLRYRTGDLVRLSTLDPKQLGCDQLALDGGVLGRADDMVLVRGVNVYPGAVDEIVRGYDQVAEYRVEITEHRGMSELNVVVEPLAGCADPLGLCRQLKYSLRDCLQLRVQVSAVEVGGLPRFEMKARRWVRK